MWRPHRPELSKAQASRTPALNHPDSQSARSPSSSQAEMSAGSKSQRSAPPWGRGLGNCKHRAAPEGHACRNCPAAAPVPRCTLRTPSRVPPPTFSVQIERAKDLAMPENASFGSARGAEGRHPASLSGAACGQP